MAAEKTALGWYRKETIGPTWLNISFSDSSVWSKGMFPTILRITNTIQSKHGNREGGTTEDNVVWFILRHED